MSIARGLILTCGLLMLASWATQGNWRLDSAQAQPASTNGAETKDAMPNKAPGFALVELYTSEGCSSCPPADAVLSDLQRVADERHLDIYCLGFNVDYWNSLGWQDRFSDARYTQRQRAYRALFQADSIYTPQMIVNGTSELNGSNKAKAAQAVQQALNVPPQGSIQLTLRTQHKRLSVSAELSPELVGHSVYAALVQDDAQSHVARGENAGRQLLHRQLVRDLQSSPANTVASLSLTLNVPDDLPSQDLSVVAFVQNSQTGAILAATQSRLP